VFVVDTNVLVYAASEESPEHGRCHEKLDGWRESGEPWYLTWPIVYEFLRITTHPRVWSRPWSARQALTFIHALLASPGLGILSATDRHADTLSRVLEELPDVRANVVHDVHTAVLMREHGIRRIITRDNDFHRFPFLEVVDPLSR